MGWGFNRLKGGKPVGLFIFCITFEPAIPLLTLPFSLYSCKSVALCLTFSLLKSKTIINFSSQGSVGSTPNQDLAGYPPTTIIWLPTAWQV